MVISVPNRSAGLRRWVLQDWQANRGNPKGRLVLTAFRLAQWVRHGPRNGYLLGLPYLVAYRLAVEWVLGVELPWNTRIGPGLRLFHGQALVVNDGSVLGAHCTLRHATTLGHLLDADGEAVGCPTLGDRVDVGPNVVILGPVTIGDGARIGAGAVVVHDVEPGAVMIGNPARPVSWAASPRD